MRSENLRSEHLRPENLTLEHLRFQAPFAVASVLVGVVAGRVQHAAENEVLDGGHGPRVRPRNGAVRHPERVSF